jgi:hypothetical protein
LGPARATRRAVVTANTSQHTQIPREGSSSLPSAATSDASTHAARGPDMISRRDHAQRPRGTHAKSLRRPVRALAHTLTQTHERVAGSDPPATRTSPAAPPMTDPPVHARSTGCAPQNEEQQPVATTPRHGVTRREHPTVARIGCRGASRRASSGGSGGEGGVTAARLTAAQRQPSQLGRR